MIIKGNYEKKIQIIRSKLPGLNILRKNEREWEITGKEPTSEEKKEIEKIIEGSESINLPICQKEIKIEKGVVKMAEIKQNGYEQAKERISAGIAIISETVKAEIFPEINAIKESLEALKTQVNSIDSKNEESRNRQIESIQRICDELTQKVNEAGSKLEERIYKHFESLDSRYKEFENTVLSSFAEKETEIKNLKSFQDKLKSVFSE